MSVTASGDFGPLLRAWRTRRRLSQIDLAIDAETTQRHLSFLEQGRSMPGREIVGRLAESLQLTLRQRNELFGAAGFVAAYPESDLHAPGLEPVRTALQHVLDGHRPYPAMVMDGFGQLVAFNSAFPLLSEGVAPWLLEPPVNVLRVALHPDGLAARIVNIDDWRRHILSGLHQRAPHPRIEALIEELEGYGRPAGAAGQPLGFATPLQLRTADGDVRLIATISTFATAIDITLAELRLEAFLPADEQTAAILARRFG